MKTIIISLCAISFLFLGSLSSCEQVEPATPSPVATAENKTASFDPDQDMIAQQVDDQIQLAITPATLEKALKKANPKVTTLQQYSFRADANGGEEYDDQPVTFLLAEVGLKNGGHQLIVLHLEQDQTHYRVNRRINGNTCTGHCCSKCQWSRRAGSPYYTCWCVSSSTSAGCGSDFAHCDHALSTPDVPLIKKIE